MISWGGRYEGAFDNDKRHGRGTYTWANGDRCVRHAGAGCLPCLGAAACTAGGGAARWQHAAGHD